jgi:hypothetical protein
LTVFNRNFGCCQYLEGAGRCSASAVIPIQEYRTSGRFIDPARWDGSDFFMADNNHEILIVSATAKRLQELRLNHVVLEEAGLESVRSS